MTLSELFRAAAERVYTNEYLMGACAAINWALPPHVDGALYSECPACQFSNRSRVLKTIFAPDSEQGHYWLGKLTRKNRDTRVYALLLAAECWEDFK